MTSSSEFVHLHVHSQYSMLDGAIRLKELVDKAKALGMSALALTDHGNMFGAVQLTKACNDAGIKPILGCEVNIVAGSRSDPTQPSAHLVLLVRSQTGYRNLVRLVSRGWVDGLSRSVPRIDFDLLREHREGLVGLSACMGGYLAQEILWKGERAGLDAMARLRDSFEEGSFFVELQDHGFVEQKPLNEILIELARKLSLGLVATNDCHYLERDHAKAQLVLQCIAAGRTIEEMRRTHHASSDMYLKTPDEMAALFAEVPESIRNTMVVAEMCGGAASPIAAPQLPRFTVPPGESEESYLRALSQKGLEERFTDLRDIGKSVDEDEYRRRLAMEADVICSMGFAGYFLIVQDFINWGKRNGVPVGPGRGSGAGSLVAYALRITDIDPLPYGLLFERFLNPERVSMPDFDVDFCMDRRDHVIDYVREKYGSESVGQIATFHLLKSRSVVRDVGRAMDMTVQEAGRIAQLIPEPVQGKSVPIQKALEQEARLSSIYEQESKVKELLDTAMGLEELTRHAGMHAAGVVISEGPLWDHVPVFCPEPQCYVTQYHKDDVEAAGLVKFDFLGLKTLTVIDIATRLINRRPDRNAEEFRIDRIALDDPATYALLQSGETTHVFQLESSGMQNLFKQLKPDCFEDIIAAVALYRPGPLGSGMVEDFIQRKHRRVRVEYPHPSLENTLKETYGVIVYQEQVMQAARDMAGYTLGGADLLRRAMGKKKPEEMAKQKATFIEGAVAEGYSAADAERVFELIAYFAGYGFNKSHSAAYAMITYQTAFLKAHYPVEFTCATLTADRDKTEKVVRSVAEARAMGITVLPPDVNDSEIDFTVVYDEAPSALPKATKDQPVALGGKLRDPWHPKIRFGLGGVKGIGTAALEAIFESRSQTTDATAGDERGRGEQPFSDLFDFTSRVDLRRVNKTVVEALVQCGAFDAVHKAMGVERATAFANIESAFEQGKKTSAERSSGQTNLFGLFESAGESLSGAAPSPRFVGVGSWDARELLTRERNSLGFYVSGHPLDRYATELERFCNGTTADLAGRSEGSATKLGGMVEGYRERPTRAGSKIAFFALEDRHGRVEVVVRPQMVEASREALCSGQPVLVSGTIQYERERGGPGGGPPQAFDDDTSADAPAQVKIVLDEVVPLAESLHARATWVRVTLDVESLTETRLLQLRDTLARFEGSCPLDLELRSAERWTVRLKKVASVEASESLLGALERLFGQKVCELRWPEREPQAPATRPVRAAADAHADCRP